MRKITVIASLVCCTAGGCATTRDKVKRARILVETRDHVQRDSSLPIL